MGRLDEQLKAALSPFFGADWFGREVVYNDVPVQAIFRPTADPAKARAGSAATAELQIETTILPAWAVGDRVMVDGETWRVRRAGPGSGNLKHVLDLERDKRLQP